MKKKSIDLMSYVDSTCSSEIFDDTLCSVVHFSLRRHNSISKNFLGCLQVLVLRPCIPRTTLGRRIEYLPVEGRRTSVPERSHVHVSLSKKRRRWVIIILVFLRWKCWIRLRSMKSFRRGL